jgi:uncharacterized lipoprotein YddW (UPF0748 family)
MVNNIMKWLWLLILATTIPVMAVLPAKGQIRGMWVVRHNLTSAARIDNLLKLARDCGITDLFVQVRGRGDAYYVSQYESRAEDLPDSTFDPLDYILTTNRRSSLRIHAWLNVFYIWSKDSLPRNPNHIVHRNAGWLARPAKDPHFIADYPNSLRNNNVEGLFVSPLQPEAQQYFLNIVTDILERYTPDGIHLDYIRYPDQSFDVNPDVVKGFRNRYVLNPEEFLSDPEVFAQKFSISGYEVFAHSWRRYLMDGLSDFVRRISETVHKLSPDVYLSAAVKPDIVQAHWNYYQAWDHWVKEGWLDFAVAMNYATDSQTFVSRVDDYLNQLPSGTYLVGIALYNQKEDQIVRKIARVGALKNSGFVLFSYDQLKKMPYLKGYLVRLKDGGY